MCCALEHECPNLSYLHNSLAVVGLFYLSISFRISLLMSTRENRNDFNEKCTESVQPFEDCIKSSNLGQQTNFLFIETFSVPLSKRIWLFKNYILAFHCFSNILLNILKDFFLLCI